MARNDLRAQLAERPDRSPGWGLIISATSHQGWLLIRCIVHCPWIGRRVQPSLVVGSSPDILSGRSPSCEHLRSASCSAGSPAKPSLVWRSRLLRPPLAHWTFGLGSPSAVELEPFIGDGGAGDVAAQLFEFIALSQWNRKRQHPLPYRHPGNDVSHQVSRRFGHAPCSTGGAEPALFT